jgi:hypothetical protein
MFGGFSDAMLSGYSLRSCETKSTRNAAIVRNEIDAQRRAFEPK